MWDCIIKKIALIPIEEPCKLVSGTPKSWEKGDLANYQLNHY